MAAELIRTDGAASSPPAAWLPCSDLSRERDDPLAGTAGFGARWLLVEIEGGWGRHAFFDSRFDPGIGRALVHRAERDGIRPVAIRRFGRRGEDRRTQTRWRWALADSRAGRESVVWGVVDDPRQLLDIPLDGSVGVPSDRPVALVCTHGRHDQCCAVRGRPVARALADAFPDETWESSHLGGDRFAATMLLLPHGLSYGRVPDDEAAAIVDAYLDGRVVDEYYRGRSSLTNVVQAAQSLARAATGDDSIDALAPLAETRDEGGWIVELDHGGQVVTVSLDETRSAPLLSTCGATRAASVRQFALRSLAVDPR
jgi:hypothetical protein